MPYGSRYKLTYLPLSIILLGTVTTSRLKTSKGHSNLIDYGGKYAAFKLVLPVSRWQGVTENQRHKFFFRDSWPLNAWSLSLVCNWIWYRCVEKNGSTKTSCSSYDCHGWQFRTSSCIYYDLVPSTSNCDSLFTKTYASTVPWGVVFSLLPSLLVFVHVWTFEREFELILRNLRPFSTNSISGPGSDCSAAACLRLTEIGLLFGQW